MNSRWNQDIAKSLNNDLLKLRVYTSRLLGLEPSLVLHGGGNTSVKANVLDFFGKPVDVLYIKGSGWDLATIEEAGFPAVKMDVLKQMATLRSLSDADMVLQQRAAMLNPNAPNPSVEAILHAIIPFTFVDHTHADTVVAITNTPNGQQRIKEIYGDRVLIVPYVMPGFVLARKVFELTHGLDWSNCEGIILLNHGIFTFGNDAKTSYEQMISLVTKAEDYIRRQNIERAQHPTAPHIDLQALARMRKSVSVTAGYPVVAYLKSDLHSTGFANLADAQDIATRGTLTPDHVIRTKPKPAVISSDVEGSIERYALEYQAYFNRHAHPKLKCLDLSPRWALWPGRGLVTFAKSLKEALICSDILDHTIEAIQWAQKMGGWKVLSEQDIFEMEYWELEQAKLSLGASKSLPLQGKIALVTGAFSGIGKACVETLVAQGAHVAALDIRDDIIERFSSKNVKGIICDVSDEIQLRHALETTVRSFGGLDIVVSNAGIFPPSEMIADLKASTWDKSMMLNLTSHQRLLSLAVPFLALGLDPTFIVMGSKNVPAPGPGASAYSVAKAGLTQFARVAALELGSKGIRVNVVHPNQVFDTGIWTDEVLQKRAKSYNLSVEEYKTNNVLKVEITSLDVAALVAAMAGKAFSKTTGAQVSIDGGNERVI